MKRIIDFLKRLEQNNDRDWFNAHKAEYLDAKNLFEQIIGQVILELGQVDPRFFKKKINVVISTDHGSVRVNNPVKVIGDKNTNTNLRYKTGKSLNYNKKEVFEVRNPADVFLPRGNMSSSYIFCRRADFFAYPNNYNYYANYYRNTFQHGGLSMEEMMVPVAFLKAK